MRGTIGIVVVVALGAACGSNTPGSGSIDASSDAQAGAIDSPTGGLDGNKDVVACGTQQQPTACALPANACCDFAPGTGTPYCYAVQGGVCEGGQPIRCDGPEDCMNGEGCCYNPSSGSSCTEIPTCTPSGGEIMCHVGDDSPCGGGHCCELHSGGPSGGSVFGTCHPGSCPV